MRPRIKTNIIASSTNYNQKRAVRTHALSHNHEANAEYFEHVRNTVEVKPLTELQRFENGLKAQLVLYKQSCKRS